VIKYPSFRYIYPPRPEINLPSSELDKYDNGLWLGQPKLNGSNITIFTNGVEVYLYSRHNDILSGVKMKNTEFLSLHRGNGWIVINGEYMNKSKNNANGLVFNHKLVIFDILVYNGVQTIGMTFEERVHLLNKLYSSVHYDGYINKVTDNVYIVKSFNFDFKETHQKIVKIDMYEGWVLKKKSSRLKNGVSKKNNTDSQIKFRKSTKNYNY
jgi:ATP-dependent DNA ligase